MAVPASIPRPPYAESGAFPEWDPRPQVHDEAGLVKMRAACKLAAEVLNHAGTLVKPGVTTDEIDKAVHKMIIDAGAYPSPLNYGKFPKSVCTSVNEVICHGIPDSRPLQEGDIVNIDVTVYLNVSIGMPRPGRFLNCLLSGEASHTSIVYPKLKSSPKHGVYIVLANRHACLSSTSLKHFFDPLSSTSSFFQGYHGDTSRMFAVGAVSDTAQRLMAATTEALFAGIKVCGPGVPINAIGNAIQKVADAHKFTLCKTFVGHGVGTVFHSYPHVMHCRNNEPGSMVPGMTFTIEPMLCEGTAREKFWKDGWTAVTADGKLSAQQEHTLLITETGVEVLTVA